VHVILQEQANTFVGGSYALGNGANNTTGSDNSFFGADAGGNNTTASCNTAVGYNSLSANTTGTLNTAVGVNALRDNTTANNNTAVGVDALVLIQQDLIIQLLVIELII
jgi:trimeric autotransporter adhesin